MLRFPKQGIVSLSLTKALFKEVTMTPVSCHSNFYLCMWEAHWDILMVPPLLMSSSPSSFIYIFNCIRRLRKIEIIEPLCVCVCVCVRVCVCVHMRACLCVCHRKCNLKESTQERKMALNDWGEIEKFTIHGKDCVRRKMHGSEGLKW